MKITIFTFLVCLGLQTILNRDCFLAKYIHGPTQPGFITGLYLLFIALEAGTGFQFFPSPRLQWASLLPWSSRGVAKGESRHEVSLPLCMGCTLEICNLATARWGACRGFHTVQAGQHSAVVNISVIMLAFTSVNCGWLD